MKGYLETFNKVTTKGFKNNVFIIVGKCPKWFKGDIQGHPMIYTELSRPKPNDTKFLRGQIVHLIHGKNATDELFAKWFSEIANARPKQLFATDSTEELMVCSY